MYEFTRADIAYLSSPDGQEAVSALSARPLTDRLSDVAHARRLAGDFAAAALETALVRRKAAAKGLPTTWLYTDAAVQQATPWPVALHRAARFRDRTVHDVTCSVGVDLAALSTVAACVGSDIDPIRLAMARTNQPSAALLRADALRPVTRSAAIVADPGRRDASGRRRWRPSDFAPPLDELASVYKGRDMAVKCAPGIDFADVPWASEVEVVSLDGSVREACLWTGSLATATRRATIIRGTDTTTITDAEDDTCPVTPVDEWIIDPDGAIVRAGLVRHYAARHQLSQLDEHIAYLTGPKPPPGIRAFRVLEHGKYTEKSLRAALARLSVGRVEILVRGLDVDPNTLRPRLKLKGPNEATVILTRIGHSPTAILALSP